MLGASLAVVARSPSSEVNYKFRNFTNTFFFVAFQRVAIWKSTIIKFSLIFIEFRYNVSICVLCNLAQKLRDLLFLPLKMSLF